MLKSDFAGKPFSDEKLGGALLAAPGGVRDASGSRKRLPSRADPASPGFFTHTIQEDQPESAKRGEFDPEKLAFPVTLVPYPRL